MNKKINTLIMIVFMLLMAPSALYAKGLGGALNPPHDAARNIKCGNCHNDNFSLGKAKFGNVCTSCHTAGQSAANKPFNEQDAANPYGTVVNGYTNTPPSTVFQTSHNWAGPDTNPAAGASPPMNPAMTTSNTGGYLLCVRCHNIHGPISSATVSRPFLRMKNNNDEMCRDCHTRRDRSSHMDGTHPINLQYSTIAAKKPELFAYPPVASDPRNKMKLINGNVQCSTCHGLHYTDSRSGREHTAASAVLNLLSSSKGMLLRTNARGKNAEDINICTNCHKGKMSHNDQIVQQNIQCNDCHSGHVEYDPQAFTAAEKTPNKYMIRRYMNISTQYGAVRKVRTFYRYTGSENPNKDPGTDGKEFFREVSGLGVCQGCHNDSVKFVNEHRGGNKANNVDINHKKCNSCHTHSGGSFSGGCSNCHGYPPSVNKRGRTPILGSNPLRFEPGYAFWSSANAPTKHTYAQTLGFLDESKTPHTTHADRTLYALSCEECHKGKTHNAGTDNYRQVFINKVAITASNIGAFVQYSTTGVDGRYNCTNIYCHSNGRGGDYKTVTWKNSKDTIVKGNNRCQSCHGDKKNIETATGVSALSGAHQRHAALSKANFTCQNCHGATLRGGFDNNSGLVYPALNHVNGVKNVKYSFPTNFNLDYAMSPVNYANNQQCGNIYCHSNGKNKYPTKVTPKWDDPSTGKCGTCHEVRGPETTKTFGMMTSNAHFRHLSSVYGPNLLKTVGPLPEDAPTACMRCHTLFGGAEEKHVKGSIFGDTRVNSPCYKCHGGWQQGAFKPEGGSDKLVWSQKTRVACTQCHPTWGGYSAARIGNILAPKQINYSASGHGKSAVPFKNKNTLKKIDCSDCHNQNSGHIRPSAAGEHSSRLKTYSNLSATFVTFGNYTGRRRLGNAVCNSCHWEGQSAAKKVMFTHVTSLSEARNGTPTMACSRCHNVHGSDGGHMVRNKVVFRNLSAFINYSSAYFITYSSADSTVVKKKDQKRFFKFIDLTTNRGLCQVCHVNTKHFKNGISEKDSGPTTGVAGKPFVNHTKMGVGMNCLSCHPHTPPPGEGTYAFFPFGVCNKCHGYPPVPKKYKTGQNNYSSAHIDPNPFENLSGSGGSHIVKGHVDPSANPSESWANCNKCHAESDHLTVTKFEEVMVSMPDKKFNNTIQHKYSSNRLGGSNHLVGTCYNVSCHFQRTPKWGNKP
ncbi:MAG TPA: CxxxxCH/CxxCH domain-containing protein [Desulfuromonadaceae bacterium]|jgi:predicted CxxxxCH...CXXCH cytochrome family protein